MIEKDFASKLAAGMRRAKQAPAVEVSAPASAPAPPRAAARPSGRPTACPDNPWNDLHPARVWPD